MILSLILVRALGTAKMGKTPTLLDDGRELVETTPHSRREVGGYFGRRPVDLMGQYCYTVTIIDK